MGVGRKLANLSAALDCENGVVVRELANRRLEPKQKALPVPGRPPNSAVFYFMLIIGPNGSITAGGVARHESSEAPHFRAYSQHRFATALRRE
jgi:hypothetical protein